jgi:hypothetical protein
MGTARANGAHMNPRTIASLAVLVTAPTFALACGGRDVVPPPTATSSPPSSSGDGPGAHGPEVHLDSTGPAYPGNGFRVHEWGTHTIVLGSDGSMQRGLQHEEEGLPSFVYDRTKKELATPHVEVKMETPVLYFYSDKPVPNARVGVDFPKGLLTQWYPGTTSFSPMVLDTGDPALDLNFPYTSDSCRASYAEVHDGSLLWGSVDVLGRDATINAPDAPLDRFTWSHARAVAANPLRAKGLDFAGKAAPDEEEHFIFYRGLGSFPLDLDIRAQTGEAGFDGGLVLQNNDWTHDVGAVFVLRVERDVAAFQVFKEGVRAGGSLTLTAPPATLPHDAYAQALAQAMVQELDARGLYHDESVAMVKTWARQWFTTPGVRLLYLAPQQWTEAQIPLTIDPSPMELVRQMVIRAEILTPSVEDTDLKYVAAMQTPEAIAHFDALGRFAEPRLRRALALLGTTPAPAADYLARIQTVHATSQAGE